MKKATLFIIVSLATLILGMFYSEVIMFRISTLCILIICLLWAQKEEKLVNPYSLFAFVPFSLSIYVNIGSYYMQDLTPATWILAIINMLAFLVGLRVTKSVNNTNLCVGVGTTIGEYQKHALLLTIVGTIPYLYYAATNSIFPLASVITLFSMPGLMCAITSRKKSLILACIAIIVSPMIIGHTSKSSVLTIALCFIIAYEKFYVRTEKDRKKLLLIGALGVILMLFSFSFANKERGAYNAQEGMEQYENNGIVWEHDASLYLPYMYLTTPWANLQYVTETQDTRTNGLWLVKPILSYLQIDDNFKEQYRMQAYSNFNTFTFIAVHFKDFGFWGSILISLLLGFYVKKIYSLYIISNSPLDIAMFVLVGQAVLEMFFSNHFFTQSYPFTILILMWIYKKTVCANKPLEIDIR